MPGPTLRDVHVDALMTNISVAYRNTNYIGELIFPRVPVSKKSDVYFTYGKSAWFRDEVGVRAPGAEARRGDYDVTTASYVAITRAIAKLIPDEVRANADMPLRPDVEATEWVTDQLLRAQERRVAALTTGGSALWAYAASPVGAQWSSDTSDPWGDIDAAIYGIVSNTGVMPNTMVMSWNVWRHLRQHPDFLDRVKYVREAGRVETSDVSQWFNLPKVLVGTQLYDPAKEGQTASPTMIWGDQVWIGYVTPAPALMAPTAGYTFEWLGREVSRYRLDTSHADLIEAQHSTAEVISASDAGAVIYDAV